MKPDLYELFARNSAYVPLYRAALAACADGELVAEAAVAAVDACRSGAYQIQDAHSILESLVRNGGLESVVLVDGQRYDGTIKDAQADESIAPEASVETVYRTTADGMAMLEATDPAGKTADLIAAKPDLAAAFQLVLDACSAEGGAATRDLQQALRDADALPKDARTGVETLHASYFTGALENAGALEWKGGRWHTTQVGRRATA